MRPLTALRAKLRDPRSIAKVVAHEPLDVETLDELLPLMSIDGYAVLLDALAKSGNRATRRKLLDKISETAARHRPADRSQTR